MRLLAAIVMSLLVTLTAAACAGGPGRQRLSYAEVQAINPGVRLDWLMQEYPAANQTRDPAGRVRQVELPVTDPYGKAQSLFLEFDESGVCTRKIYTGAVVRPAK